MNAVKTTMLDYLDWRGDISFLNDPVNEVDCLVFSTLSYVDFSTVPFVNSTDTNMAPRLSQVYDALMDVKQGDAEFMKLFGKCAVSNRYRDITVFGYESVIKEDIQLQFAAVSFLLPSGEAVLTFRGTDDSIIGWKEDLNMSFEEVPAQKQALKYVKKIAKSTQGSQLYLTGHSKGGNLAVWAGANLSEKYRNRLVKIYDNDGPGFCGDFTKSEGFEKIKDKTVKFVVDSSVIGMLLDNESNRCIVASNEASTLMQHYPMSWLVVGNKFHCLKERSSIAKTTELIISKWINELSYDDRRQMSEIVFDIISSSKAKTVSDLRGKDALVNMTAMLKAYADTDKEKKQFLLNNVGKLNTIIKSYAKMNISNSSILSKFNK